MKRGKMVLGNPHLSEACAAVNAGRASVAPETAGGRRSAAQADMFAGVG